jgi:hypothetical protein
MKIEQTDMAENPAKDGKKIESIFIDETKSIETYFYDLAEKNGAIDNYVRGLIKSHLKRYTQVPCPIGAQVHNF